MTVPFPQYLASIVVVSVVGLVVGWGTRGLYEGGKWLAELPPPPVSVCMGGQGGSAIIHGIAIPGKGGDVVLGGVGACVLIGQQADWLQEIHELATGRRH